MTLEQLLQGLLEHGYQINVRGHLVEHSVAYELQYDDDPWVEAGPASPNDYRGVFIHAFQPRGDIDGFHTNVYPSVRLALAEALRRVEQKGIFA